MIPQVKQQLPWIGDQLEYLRRYLKTGNNCETRSLPRKSEPRLPELNAPAIYRGLLRENADGVSVTGRRISYHLRICSFKIGNIALGSPNPSINYDTRLLSLDVIQ